MGKCKRQKWRDMVATFNNHKLTSVRKAHLHPRQSDPDHLGGLGSKLWVDQMLYKTMVRLECRRRGLL